MFYTYILYSKSLDQYYTGYTSVGVGRRLARHNSGSSPSTRPGIPWEVVYMKGLEKHDRFWKPVMFQRSYVAQIQAVYC